MIELDVIAHLKASADLDTLLGSSATNSKIFPIQAPQGTAIPFVVYEVSTAPYVADIALDEDTIQFNIFDDDYLDCRLIAEQIKKLLGISDSLRVGVSTSISSATYYIYNGIDAGSSEFKDTDTDLFVRVISFSFKYKRKV